MTVSIGGIILSDNLILRGLEESAMVAHSVTYTLGGSAIVQSAAMDAEVGIELSLAGDNDFTLKQIQDVRALRGQTVSLVHPRGTFDVIVLQTPTTPTINYADPVSDDWYSGEIKMVTV